MGTARAVPTPSPTIPLERGGTPWRVAALALALLTAGCAPGAAAPQTEAQARAPEIQTAPSRTLVIVVGRMVESLGSKPLRDTGQSGSPVTMLRAFNAGLAIHDDHEQSRAYLAASLPELRTETWRVLPDGRMELTYQLRPNLVWHDGAPLTAEDFVFAWRVYSRPEFGFAASPPVSMMEDVVAPDAGTVVFRWRQVYNQADDLQAADLPPLPRHILEAPLAQQDANAFIAHPFWLTDYVGLGPYRIRQMELGSWLEGDAFDAHALGRPRIDRVRFLGVPDPNVVVTTLLSDTARVATDTTITDEQQAAILERDWSVRGGRNAGLVLRSPLGVRHVNIQLRPDYANPPALLDVRVRKALAYASDRQALADAVTQGLTPVADTLILRELDYYPAVDRAITKYPYDLRSAQELMAEAGFNVAGDGFYASPTQGRFSVEVASPQGARNETEITILAEGLNRAGFDARVRVIPRAQITEPLVSSHYPGFFNAHANRAFEPPIQWLRASAIAREETRWRGSNWSGFNDPEFERLVTAYETVLDRTQRNQHVVDMLRRVSEEVPTYALYYSRLHGPRRATRGSTSEPVDDLVQLEPA